MNFTTARFFYAVPSVAVLATALLTLPLPAQETARAATETAAADAATTAELLDRIQRECLRAYPEDLLADMASGARDIPQEVEADPKAQMQFLDKEEPLEKGLFYPSLLEDLLPALEAYVTPGIRFLDLGSGDGRAVFLAAALGADATGIEYDERMVAISRNALEALADAVDRERAHILQGDFFETSWAAYDLIYYFDLSSFEQERVRAKLAREVDPEARLIIGHEQKPFPGFELEAAFGGHPRRPAMRIYRRIPQPSDDGPAMR